MKRRQRQQLIKTTGIVLGIAALIALIIFLLDPFAASDAEIQVYRDVLWEYYGSELFFLDTQSDTGPTDDAPGYDVTDLRQTVGLLPVEMQDLQADTLQDFIERNSASSPIPRDIGGASRIRYATEDEYGTVLESSDSIALNREIGDFVQVSHVGFNEDQTQALLLIQVHCGQGCFGGEFLLLAREADNHWRIVESVIGWES